MIPPSTTASPATPSAMDSAALRSCQRCHRRMSSLKYDTPTLCTHCRDVNCNLSTRCDECGEWSSDFMNAYLSHKRSLASKRSKKPQPAASVSQPAVTAGPSLGSPVSVPSFADDDRLKEAVMSALQSLTKKGSLGSNPFPFAAPFPVPDSESHQRDSSGGDGSHQPHNVGGTTRTSAVGACEVKASVVSTHSVPSCVSLSNRSEQVMSRSLESVASASLGSQPFPSISSGLDQLCVTEGGPLGISVSSLSPTSLMFPLLDSGFSSLPGPSSSVPAFFLLLLFLRCPLTSLLLFLPLPFLFLRLLLLPYPLLLFLRLPLSLLLCLLWCRLFSLPLSLFLSLLLLRIPFRLLPPPPLLLLPLLGSLLCLRHPLFLFLFPFLLLLLLLLFYSTSSSCRSGFFFSSWIFSSLLFFFFLLGFLFFGVGRVSCECFGSISGLSIASPLVCAFWGGGFCRVGAFVFSSLTA